MARSYVHACILMLLSSVTSVYSQEEIIASSLDELMYQTENDVDTGPGPVFGEPTNYNQDLGPGKDRSDEPLLMNLMVDDDRQIRSFEDYGSKWDSYYKPPLHSSPKRAFAGLIEQRSVQEKLRAQAKERKRMMSAGGRRRADSAQQEWKAKKGRAASRHMVCYFKLCSWRG